MPTSVKNENPPPQETEVKPVVENDGAPSGSSDPPAVPPAAPAKNAAATKDESNENEDGNLPPPSSSSNQPNESEANTKETAADPSQNLVVPLIQAQNGAGQYAVGGSVTIPHAIPGQDDASEAVADGKETIAKAIDANATENLAVNGTTSISSDKNAVPAPEAAANPSAPADATKAKIQTASSTSGVPNDNGVKKAASSDITPLFTLNDPNETTAPGATATTAAPAHANAVAAAAAAVTATFSGTAIPTGITAATPKEQEQQQQQSVPINSNFWQQEEEERFLLGLRLYGWGQWKRIQTIVKTRTNKQIKSHAQKREKVNPTIKEKYGKGKSRRGRISSKVLAADAARGYSEAVTVANDPNMPTLDVVWKDVYGTNNGNGPNSRLRRYRNSFTHQQWLQHGVMPAQAPQLQPPPHQQQQQQPPPPPLPAQAPPTYHPSPYAHHPHMPPGMPYPYPHHHAVMPPMQRPPPQGAYPVTAAGVMPSHHHPSAVAIPAPPPAARLSPKANPSLYSTSSSTALPPIPAAAPQDDGRADGAPTTASNQNIAAKPSVPAPSAKGPSTEAKSATGKPVAKNPVVPPREVFFEPLRPGMRVYARYQNGPTWRQGVIYSAKVDTSRITAANASKGPALLYHIHYDDKTDDSSVREDYVLSKKGYEAAILDLERHFALARSDDNSKESKAGPLDAGTPVYAQWIDKMNPRRHARWLPGTVHSSRKEGDGHVYHILFDEDDEKDAVSEKCVLERTVYQELMAQKYPSSHSRSNGHLDSLKANWLEATEGGASVVDIETNNPFLKKVNDADLADRSANKMSENSNGASQNDEQPGALDLLFTASQMSAPMAAEDRGTAESNKRPCEAHDSNETDECGQVPKKSKTESMFSP